MNPKLHGLVAITTLSLCTTSHAQDSAAKTIRAWLRLARWCSAHHAIMPVTKTGAYNDLCGKIDKFFKTGKSPVSAEETIEIFTFMEAADESKRQGGAPVALADVLAKAKAEADAKLAR
jgi:hypothetical protein